MLCSGSAKAQTFMQKPATVFTKFTTLKKEFTKVWEWCDK